MAIYEFESKKPTIGNNCFIAPNATIIGNVIIEDNCSIWFNTVIRGDVNKITIKSGTNIQDSSVVHVNTDRETTIGKNVTVGHGVLIHACTIKDDALIGNRSVIHDNAIISERTLIAPGCVVTDRTEIPAECLVVGIPGKIKRSLNEKDFERMKENNRRYQMLIPRYLSNFKESRKNIF